jgi:hypothetical protein
MILAKELLFCSTLQSAQWDPQLPQTFCTCSELKYLWDDYLRSYKINTTYSTGGISDKTGLSISAVNLISRITMIGARTWQLTLSEVLCNYARQTCRLPVDNVYAYQGLVVIGSRIQTDYARSHFDLFIKTLRIIAYEKKHNMLTKAVAESISSILMILYSKLSLAGMVTLDQMSIIEAIVTQSNIGGGGPNMFETVFEEGTISVSEPDSNASLVRTVTRNDFALWKQIHVAIKKGLLKEELFGDRLIQLRARKLQDSSPLLWTELQWSEWLKAYDEECSQ